MLTRKKRALTYCETVTYRYLTPNEGTRSVISPSPSAVAQSPVPLFQEDETAGSGFAIRLDSVEVDSTGDRDAVPVGPVPLDAVRTGIA